MISGTASRATVVKARAASPWMAASVLANDFNQKLKG